MLRFKQDPKTLMWYGYRDDETEQKSITAQIPEETPEDETQLPNFKLMTEVELRTYAEKNEIDISKATSRASIIKLLTK